MSQRRYAANHFASCRWVASCKLRRATCNRQPSQTARRTSHVASLCPGLWTDHRQRRRRLHVADCSSQNRCQACAHGVDRAAWSGCKPASRNPRAAIRELWASRKPQLADCSSQHRGQACAEARLQLAEHRSQLADRGAGSPVPPIAACTSQLARRRLLRRGSKADPILLSQNRRPHSRRSQHFGQEVKADPILLSQNRRPHSRRSQHFGQEVKAEVNCGSHSRSSLVARCRSLSRRDYLHEDRLHACKVQGA